MHPGAIIPLTILCQGLPQLPRSEEKKEGIVVTKMERFTDILRDATAAISPEYFLLPIHGGNSIYRERVYCYELYHQMRRLWPTESPYRLNGEVDKRAHPYFQNGEQPKPDLLVHQPGTGENYAVIEVKSCLADARGIRKDLETLALFRNEIGYQRAIYLVYGAEAARTMALVQEIGADTLRDVPIELWLHPAAQMPAGN